MVLLSHGWRMGLLWRMGKATTSKTIKVTYTIACANTVSSVMPAHMYVSIITLLPWVAKTH